MHITKILKNVLPFMLAVVAVCTMTACGDDKSSSPTQSENDDPSKTKDDDDNKDEDNVDANDCSFKISDKVWKFVGWMNITEIYTWKDEKTVQHETWMNAYHMEDHDEVLNIENRQEFYEEIQEDCAFYIKNAKDAETSQF